MGVAASMPSPLPDTSPLTSCSSSPELLQLQHKRFGHSPATIDEECQNLAEDKQKAIHAMQQITSAFAFFRRAIIHVADLFSIFGPLVPFYR